MVLSRIISRTKERQTAEPGSLKHTENMNDLNEIFRELEAGFINGEPTDLNMKLDHLHSERYTLIIEDFIKRWETTEDDFNHAAKQHPGLDLLYSDYATQETRTKNAELKIRDEA